MRLRVVSWNLDARPMGRLDAKMDLLREVAPDLALLQEVRRPLYKTLLPHALAHERMFERPRIFSWGALSTDLSDPPGSDRRLGCAVLGAGTSALLRARLLDAGHFPIGGHQAEVWRHRTLAARVAVAGGTMFTVASFHARPSVGHGSAFFDGVAAWLAAVDGPVVYGMDAGAGLEEADHVGASPGLRLVAVERLHDEAGAAGSDHPLVVADVEIEI